MKTQILGVLGALLLCSCAAPHVQLPSPEPVRHSIVAAQGTTKEAQAKISQAQASLTASQNKVKEVQQNIVKLQQELTQNKQDLRLVSGIASEVDQLSEELLTTQDALKGSQEKLANTQGGLKMAVGQIGTLQQELTSKQTLIDNATRTAQKYHKLKYSICFLAAGTTALVVGYVLFQFWAVLAGMGALGIGIAAGAGIGFPTLVFTYLMFKL